MEFNLQGKKLNKLDKFVLEFCEIAKKVRVEYVIVSGYISILFGRARATEDVDILTQPLSYKKFVEFWKLLKKKKFYCINTDDVKEAYDEFFLKHLPLRFAKVGTFIPNIEMKKIKNKIDEMALDERIVVKIGPYRIFISPIELQIAYKLFLGSIKDLEDAKFLFEMFKESIDQKKMVELIKALNVNKKVVEEWLGIRLR
ncbi:MAG: hypothetical protein J7K98_02890 [Candidatus Aenigmarchaeota archaeon]|nr:hypothetical protein [Candidatus Aenigmarchaeota archaeon]